MCKHPMPKGLRFAILQKTIRRQMDEYVRETGLTGTQVGVLGELGFQKFFTKYCRINK